MNDELFTRFVRGQISEKTYLNGGTPPKITVGARVRANDLVGNQCVKNAIGTVLRCDTRIGGYVTVEYDEYIDGHNGDGLGKDGHVWNTYSEDLEVI